MDTLIAAEVLAALGHESRHTIFRLLVETGPEGMTVGPITEVPVMLLVIKVVNASKGWYEAR